jgi:hypothetical protein
MQVRPDSRACDHFLPLGSPPQHAAPSLPEERREPAELRQESAEQPGLCTVGQKSLVLAVGILIIIVTWLLYTCATV